MAREKLAEAEAESRKKNDRKISTKLQKTFSF